MKKRCLSILLTVSLLLTLIAPLSVSAATYQQVADEATEICEAIDMVVGTGSGLTPAYLASTPKRYGGAKLIVALRGYLDISLIYPFSDNFTDYMDLTWVQGRNILGYLKEHPSIGYNGKPDGSFAPNDNMTVKEYYKLMLVSLGYIENTDFSWSGSATMPSVMELATTAGLVWLDENDAFTMEKLCVATVEALKATRKGSTDTLAQWLVDQGAIDPAIASAYNLITPVAVVSATATGYHNYEIAVVNGETVISIQLNNGIFSTDIGGNNLTTQLLLDGIDGDLDTVVSFDSAVSLTYQNVSRLSDTLITIAIPTSPNYRIATHEAITITIDPSLIQEAPAAALTTSFTIADVGSGTIDHPWQLYRSADFAMMNQEPDDQYSVMGDIDFESQPFTPVNRFAGILYGNNRKLSNIVIQQVAPQTAAGLFLVLDDGAVISNLYIENAIVTGIDSSLYSAGVLAGISGNVSLTNVNVDTGEISLTSVTGGLIGAVDGQTTLDSCQIDGLSIQSSRYIGGFVGSVSPSGNLGITDSSIDNFTATGSYSVGGMVGLVAGNAGIYDSTASVDLTGTASLFNTSDVGGVIGTVNNSTTVSGCKTYGTLTGYSDVGGIVGYTNSNLLLDSNHSGIDTYTYKYLMFDYVSTAIIHRILGRDDGLTSMDNTGSSAAVLIRDADGTDHTHWVSDVAGLDGEDALLFLMPDFTIYIPAPIVPGPVLPDIIWDLGPLFP
ncbi:MAG: hypothetical protein PF505_01250 [Vallitaleaceae bacterium]|jgi:hypothetical protein|nr:hypothetical protein [Vallitaleaceae bacterium]